MKCFTLIILIFAFEVSFAQDSIEEKATTICDRFEFVREATPQNELVQASTKWVAAWLQCQQDTMFFEVKNFNFDLIHSRSLVRLKSQKPTKDHIYHRIALHQWTFSDDLSAKAFEEIVTSLDSDALQFCVSKGGLRWWREGRQIYFLTSEAFVTSFLLDEIQVELQQ